MGKSPEFHQKPPLEEQLGIHLLIIQLSKVAISVIIKLLLIWSFNHLELSCMPDGYFLSLLLPPTSQFMTKQLGPWVGGLCCLFCWHTIDAQTPFNVAEAMSADAPFLANDDYSICYAASQAWTTSLGWLSGSIESSLPPAISSNSQLKHAHTDEELQTVEASAIHNHQRL